MRHSIFKSILVGFDGSQQSRKAADIALEMARSLDATVLLFAVARPQEPASMVEFQANLEDAQEHFEQDFLKLRATAAALGVDLATDIVVGHPAEQIIHRAEQDGVDLVILGRRGISLFEKWKLGSISERVLRYAHCPVMVVK